MPSFASKKVNLNFEPLPGLISITPNSGNSLSTQFIISLSEFADEDTPLTYTYFLYLKVKYMHKKNFF
jgi:hypothetical protein